MNITRVASLWKKNSQKQNVLHPWTLKGTGIRNNALILLFLADIVCDDNMRFNALDFYVQISNKHSWSWSNLFFSKEIFCTFIVQLKCYDVSSKKAPVRSAASHGKKKCVSTYNDSNPFETL